MMKYLTFIFIVLASTAAGQYNPDAKRDYVWYTGWGNSPPLLGKTFLNFNTIVPTFDTITSELNIYGTNSGLCDSYGNPLFFSNGMQVVDKNLQIMPNGDSLNYGYWYNQCQNFGYAYGFGQGVISFQIPGSQNNFVILHEKYLDSCNDYHLAPYYLYYTSININSNNGLGAVLTKNNPVLLDTLDWGSISAVRHGNGRDWWIVVPRAYYDCYHILSLDPSGFNIKNTQCLSELRRPEPQAGCSTFSPDGNFFARVKGNYTLSPLLAEIFAFDRCAGYLNRLTGFLVTDMGGSGGIAISPNSRYLYIARTNYVRQYDLLAADIASSMILVATCDHMPNTINNWSTSSFGTMQLGPDGKIYVAQGNSNFFAVIHNPDLMGVACNVVQHELIFPRIISVVPHFPNFRLGRLVGSLCDTILQSGIEETAIIESFEVKANPNPSSGVMQFELNGFGFNVPGELDIFNSLGVLIEQIPVSAYQGIIPYNVGKLSEAVYIAVYKQKQQVKGKVKFMVKK